MIDTKELRNVIREIGLNGICIGEINELLDRLEAAEKEREVLRAKIEVMKRQGPSVPDDVRKDAERYRFLEHLCATGSYGGIISRKAE